MTAPAASVLGVMGTLAIVIFSAAAIVLAAIVRAFVLTVMWGWFVMPTFGLRELSIPAAMGLSLILGMLTNPGTNKYDDHDKAELFGVLVGAAFGPLLILVLGAIVQLWMPQT